MYVYIYIYIYIYIVYIAYIYIEIVYIYIDYILEFTRGKIGARWESLLQTADISNKQGLSNTTVCRNASFEEFTARCMQHCYNANLWKTLGKCTWSFGGFSMLVLQCRKNAGNMHATVWGNAPLRTWSLG